MVIQGVARGDTPAVAAAVVAAKSGLTMGAAVANVERSDDPFLFVVLLL